jgi:hypothetical protein
VHDVVAVQIGQPADELAEHDACVILLIAPFLTQRLSKKERGARHTGVRGTPGEAERRPGCVVYLKDLAAREHVCHNVRLIVLNKPLLHTQHREQSTSRV